MFGQFPFFPFPLRIFVMFGEREKGEQPVHHTPSEIGTGSMKRAFPKGEGI
jgi:hypothetical protein